MNAPSRVTLALAAVTAWSAPASATPIERLQYRFDALSQAQGGLHPLNEAAVFLKEGAREPDVRRGLIGLGYDENSIEVAVLAGTLIVPTTAKGLPAPSSRLVAELVRLDGVEYVAPLYERDDGARLAVAPQLSVVGRGAVQVAGDTTAATLVSLDARDGLEVLALADELAGQDDVAAAEPTWIVVSTREPRYVVVEPPTRAVRRASGQAAVLPAETVWRAMCGSPGAATVKDLKGIAEANATALALMPPAGRAVAGVGGFDLEFNILSSLPAGALEAITETEAFLETVFDDPVTVTINLEFANLGSGILGATGSSYLLDSYPDVRDGLQADMDFDDTIQEFLPLGNSIPVRYNGNSESVTNEGRVFVTRANYNAAIGSAGGTSASMTFNTDFSWYFGVGRPPSGLFDFRSVLVHEVGHALGFTSGADFRSSDLETLDLYRFQRSDGSGTDHNPDTLEEFQLEPRMVDQDAPGTLDDVNSDLIFAEHRMSDGSPRQASHFHDQSPPIGIMDPTLASGQTFYPDYFLTPDTDMFDAIGWDYPSTAGCDVAPPEPEPAATAKNRYLGFTPPAAGTPTALRVRLVSLLDPADGAPAGSPDLSAFEGAFRWVGSPTEYLDSVTNGTTFFAAPLSCEPVCVNWNDVDAVQVFGAEIVPNSTYEIQAVDCECDLGNESLYSDALVVSGAQWGDVTLPFQFDGGPAQPDFNDISALVAKFQDEPTALNKPRAQLQPNVVDPSQLIDFNDINVAVNAFLGSAYPFAGPCACPSSVTCGATTCTGDGDCGSGLCIDGACTDACGRCAP